MSDDDMTFLACDDPMCVSCPDERHPTEGDPE